MKKVMLTILLLVFFLAGKAQPFSFSADVDTNRILIGEQVTLSLKAELTKESKFTWPLLADTISGLEIVETGKIDTTVSGENWVISQKLRLTSFDSGYVAIPPLGLSVDGKTASSPAIAIEVGMPQLSEEQDLYDIKKPLEPPFDWLPILLWTAGILLLAALVILLVRWLLKRKEEEKLTPEQRLTPYQYALRQLTDIEKEQLWQAGKIKEYYSRLTDVIRLYLERQMNINAMESTADEVIEKVHILGLSSDLNQKTAELMRTSALVKYAREKPSGETHQRSLATVREFLDRTKPVEVESGESGVGSKE